MSVEDLLTRRFLMIADYPNNPANVGDIFTQIEGRTACSNGKGAISISELEKCTANFRELEWWECRAPEEMPQYIKYKYNSVIVPCTTEMAKELVKFGKILCAQYSPATEAEYLAQQSKV